LTGLRRFYFNGFPSRQQRKKERKKEREYLSIKAGKSFRLKGGVSFVSRSEILLHLHLHTNVLEGGDELRKKAWDHGQKKPLLIDKGKNRQCTSGGVVGSGWVFFKKKKKGANPQPRQKGNPISRRKTGFRGEKFSTSQFS